MSLEIEFLAADGESGKDFVERLFRSQNSQIHSRHSTGKREASRLNRPVQIWSKIPGTNIARVYVIYRDSTDLWLWMQL